ncbi:MAG: response regulator transcription factor [Planctomycetaceae bacterium]|nr:response regulator transcription factor [Planctomycetales bacterium]MCB9924174.1 response regulator transcription factor [Planctomycetaceae bacterium]
MDHPTVLIIAPEGPDRDGFAAGLRSSGCHVETAASGHAGENTAAVARPDVVVLPSKLPDMDALVLCQRIRNVTSKERGPIFLVTPDDDSTSSAEERAGRFDQLAIGVNAMLRWNAMRHKYDEMLRCGELSIDVAGHRANINGVELKLTPTEFRLLATLAEDPGRVYSRKQLGEACRSDGAANHFRTIDVHIKAIRHKLGEHGDLVETVHGVGYRMKQVPFPLHI